MDLPIFVKKMFEEGDDELQVNALDPTIRKTIIHGSEEDSKLAIQQAILDGKVDFRGIKLLYEFREFAHGSERE